MEIIKHHIFCWLRSLLYIVHFKQWTYVLNTDQLIKPSKEFKTDFQFQDHLSSPIIFPRKSSSCLVELWSHRVQCIESESLWHVLWFLHLLFFILSSHVIFIVAASMQTFAVKLCWWILSSVLSLPPFEAVYEGLLSVWDLGTIQEGSVGALCSSVPAQWVSRVGDGAMEWYWSPTSHCCCCCRWSWPSLSNALRLPNHFHLEQEWTPTTIGFIWSGWLTRIPLII